MDHHVYFHESTQVEDRLRRFEESIGLIIEKQGKLIMQAWDDLKAKIASTEDHLGKQSAVIAAHGQVLSDIRAQNVTLSAQVADLQAKLAAGGSITADDLNAVSATLDTASTTVDSAVSALVASDPITGNPTPVPEPNPAPAPTDPGTDPNVKV